MHEKCAISFLHRKDMTSSFPFVYLYSNFFEYGLHCHDVQILQINHTELSECVVPLDVLLELGFAGVIEVFIVVDWCCNDDKLGGVDPDSNLTLRLFLSPIVVLGFSPTFRPSEYCVV